jgi:hypothetical protein
MASRKRRRTSDTDQSDRQTRAKTRAISGERNSAIGRAAVTQLKEKGANIAQDSATPATARKRGRPRKVHVERPTKKPKPTPPQRTVASSSSTAPPSAPSNCAPSDSRLRRSKRNARSSAHATSTPCATSPQVEVTPHNSSSLQHYIYFSQVGSTQDSSAQIPPGSSSSSQSRGSSNFRLSGEVPDSESELDDDETDDPSASFHPATQTSSRTASSQSNKSDCIEHKVCVSQSCPSLRVR